MESDVTSSLWERLALPIETVVGGLFSGGLFTFLAAYCEPENTKKVVDALGSVIAPIVLLLVGSFFYLFYRVLLGEFMLYPFRHWIHDRIDAWHRRRQPLEFWSFTALLADEGVSWGIRRRVYSALRNCEEVFDPRERQQMDLLHATYHVFYLTFLGTLATAPLPALRFWSTGDRVGQAMNAWASTFPTLFAFPAHKDEGREGEGGPQPALSRLIGKAV